MIICLFLLTRKRTRPFRVLTEFFVVVVEILQQVSPQEGGKLNNFFVTRFGRKRIDLDVARLCLSCAASCKYSVEKQAVKSFSGRPNPFPPHANFGTVSANITQREISDGCTPWTAISVPCILCKSAITVLFLSFMGSLK